MKIPIRPGPRIELSSRASGAHTGVTRFLFQTGGICMQVRLKILAALTAAMFVGAAGAADEVIVKIGHVGPTSGSIAHLGKDNENGARMAIDDLNAKHVKIGGKVAHFELLAEDDAGDPKQGTAVANKLAGEKGQGE